MRALLSLAAVAVTLFGMTMPAATPASATPSRVRSTGTVVVARPGAAPVVENVGTATITVRAHANIRQVTGRLGASDGSRQRLSVVDTDGRPKHSGDIAAGDRLVVTAEDGRSTGSYTFAIADPGAAAREGVYWNADRYAQIDRTVNAHTPVFPDRRCDITSRRYAHLVRQVTETYNVGNAAGDPAVTDSPLVSASHQVWYYRTRTCSTRRSGTSSSTTSTPRPRSPLAARRSG